MRYHFKLRLLMMLTKEHSVLSVFGQVLLEDPIHEEKTH